jgi:hypothetical protein
LTGRAGKVTLWPAVTTPEARLDSSVPSGYTASLRCLHTGTR